jgi:hypothetical protein
VADKSKDQRLVFMVKIRKSNTKNSLWENENGKKFLQYAKTMVKKTKVIEDSEFFTLNEVIE